MQLVEGMRALAAIVLMFGANAQADEPKYGKVETFQPGKKYTCVPTADHKGWDCNEIAPGNAPGKQGSNVPSAETTPLPAPPQRARPNQVRRHRFPHRPRRRRQPPRQLSRSRAASRPTFARQDPTHRLKPHRYRLLPRRPRLQRRRRRPLLRRQRQGPSQWRLRHRQLPSHHPRQPRLQRHHRRFLM
jgi:hypothetical protein